MATHIKQLSVTPGAQRNSYHDLWRAVFDLRPRTPSMFHVNFHSRKIKNPLIGADFHNSFNPLVDMKEMKVSRQEHPLICK